MKIEGNKITAKEGYVLQRLFDDLIVGKEIYLGYTYSIGGKDLLIPILELPEHYTEVVENYESEFISNELNLKDLLINGLNREIQNKIISGFVWRDMKVWLSIENQMNYKNNYDLAINTNGDILPVTFKFSNDKGPVYYQFNSIEDLEEFYIAMNTHISNTLSEGWNKKNSINWTNY